MDQIDPFQALEDKMRKVKDQIRQRAGDQDLGNLSLGERVKLKLEQQLVEQAVYANGMDS